MRVQGPGLRFFWGKNVCHGTYEFQMAHKNSGLGAKMAHEFHVHSSEEVHKVSVSHFQIKISP